jgi:hypothetical protein
MWTVIGLRNKVVKDIRKMIGKLIWDGREKPHIWKKNNRLAIFSESRIFLPNQCALIRDVNVDGWNFVRLGLL